MNFIQLKDAKHLGTQNIYMGGRTLYAATYAGKIITKLMSTKHEAVSAAANIMEELSSKPILGIIGFDPDKTIVAGDRICFVQVIHIGSEHCLVVGTESGALCDLFYCDASVSLSEADFEFGISIAQVLYVCAQKLEVGQAV